MQCDCLWLVPPCFAFFLTSGPRLAGEVLSARQQLGEAEERLAELQVEVQAVATAHQTAVDEWHKAMAMREAGAAPVARVALTVFCIVSQRCKKNKKQRNLALETEAGVGRVATTEVDGRCATQRICGGVFVRLQGIETAMF